MNEWLNKKTVPSKGLNSRWPLPRNCLTPAGQLVSLKVWALSQGFISFWIGPQPCRMTHMVFCGQSPLVTRRLPRVLQAGGADQTSYGPGWWRTGGSWVTVASSWVLLLRKQPPIDNQLPVLTGRVESAGPDHGCRIQSCQIARCGAFPIHNMRGFVAETGGCLSSNCLAPPFLLTERQCGVGGDWIAMCLRGSWDLSPSVVFLCPSDVHVYTCLSSHTHTHTHTHTHLTWSKQITSMSFIFTSLPVMDSMGNKILLTFFLSFFFFFF